MPDTGASKVSTVKKSQFIALQRTMLKIKLDTIRANEATIFFRSGVSLSSIGIIQAFILVDTTIFHVVNLLTPFFLSLKDINILGIYLKKITNQLICKDDKSITIFCKWTHSWFFINKNNKIAAGICLIQAEL